MIRYYCNTCGNQVKSLSDLIDIRSSRSDTAPQNVHAFGGPLAQEHICASCVHAIKRFMTTLNNKSAPPKPSEPENIASVQ